MIVLNFIKYYLFIFTQIYKIIKIKSYDNNYAFNKLLFLIAY